MTSNAKNQHFTATGSLFFLLLTPMTLCTWSIQASSGVILNCAGHSNAFCAAGTAGAVLVEPAVTNRHVRFGENGDAEASAASNNKSAAARLKAQMQSGAFILSNAPTTTTKHWKLLNKLLHALHYLCCVCSSSPMSSESAPNWSFWTFHICLAAHVQGVSAFCRLSCDFKHLLHIAALSGPTVSGA